MERIRFGLTEKGRNGRIYTLTGFVAVFPGGDGHGGGKTGRCTLEISGPAGGVRSIAVFDRATALEVGRALLDWAGADDMVRCPKCLKEFDENELRPVRRGRKILWWLSPCCLVVTKGNPDAL
jgi:hypothetical protein